MIVVQIAITFICLLYIAASIYIGCKCYIELKEWSFSTFIFNMILSILGLVNMIVLFNIWAI